MASAANVRPLLAVTVMAFGHFEVPVGHQCTVGRKEYYLLFIKKYKLITKIFQRICCFVEKIYGIDSIGEDYFLNIKAVLLNLYL